MVVDAKNSPLKICSSKKTIAYSLAYQPYHKKHMESFYARVLFAKWFSVFLQNGSFFYGLAADRQEYCFTKDLFF